MPTVTVSQTVSGSTQHHQVHWDLGFPSRGFVQIDGPHAQRGDQSPHAPAQTHVVQRHSGAEHFGVARARRAHRVDVHHVLNLVDERAQLRAHLVEVLGSQSHLKH